MPERSLGYIGLGIMGSSMARNLLKAGHALCVFNRSPDKAAALGSDGAKVAQSAAECAAESDVLMINLPDGPAIFDLLFRKERIADNLKSGSVVIIFSTIAPKEAVEISTQLEKRNVNCLDAPVSGGDIGAKNATLTIMVGGKKEIFDGCQKYLSCVGQKIAHMGETGSGQMMKAVNQVAVALSVAAMTESLVLARGAGLPVDRALEILQSGAAGSWSFNNYAPRILKDDLKPGFHAKHMLKDLRIVLDESRALGLTLPTTQLVKELYESLCSTSKVELGNHALIEIYAPHC